MFYQQDFYKGFAKIKPQYKIIGFILIILFVIFWFSLPDPLFKEPTSFVIEDRQGELLGATVASDGQWRFPAGEAVPDKFTACILTYEDKRFYNHLGVDPLAMVRAVYKNITKSKVTSGGSTISMQVIRLSRGKQRTVWQKAMETFMSMRLEVRYSKKEILELYTSHAPFGSNVVGLEAASWRYFGRKPEALSWAESAMLAVLPNAPSMIHPGKNRDLLLKKRNFLLNKLHANNTIDQGELELALAEPLPENPLPLPQEAPHLLQRFSSEHQAKKLTTPTRLQSTLHGDLQREVTRILESHHNQLRQNSINNACAMVMEVETGNVLSYVGNVYRPEIKEWQSHVDIIRARRSPGSLLKPLLYAVLMSEGTLLPNALVADIPTQIGGYMPENYDLTYDGAVPASNAISRSLNIPAVRMLRQYNYARFYRVLQGLGISTLNQPADHYGLSMILGGCEVNMWELAGAYASLARAYNHQVKNNGKIIQHDIHPPHYTQRSTADEKDSLSNQALPLDMASLWYMFSAMEDVMRPGEESFWQQFTSSRRVAWKTGTSFGFRDGWAIGFTPEYVVSVWTGNAGGEGRPGLIGVRTAAPIMFDIFSAMPQSPWFAEPKFGFQYISVCPKSGYKAGPDCGITEEEMVPQNGSRGIACPYHKRVNLDATGEFRVTDACESTDQMQQTGWFVLPTAMEWYYKQSHFDYKPLPPLRADCESFETGESMEVIYPQSGSNVSIPTDLDGKKGEVVFSAAHRKPQTKIFWHLDDKFMGQTQTYHKLPMNPIPGKHRLTLVDELGERKSVWFMVE